MNLVTALGYVSEGAGIAVAAYGLHMAFLRYAPGQREFDPAIGWLRTRPKAASNVVLAGWRRIRGRPGDVAVTPITATLHLTGGGRVKVRTGYGYPSDKTVRGLAATMHGRTEELRKRTEDLSDQIADEADARSKADEELGTRIDAAARRIDEATRDLAIGGLRLQLVGLSLVTLGLVLQGIGQGMN
jgi:hypothetical protein